jgi:hypothetical protein
VMKVTAPQGAVTRALGPWWYWEKQPLTMAKNQDTAKVYPHYNPGIMGRCKIIRPGREGRDLHDLPRQVTWLFNEDRIVIKCFRIYIYIAWPSHGAVLYKGAPEDSA